MLVLVQHWRQNIKITDCGFVWCIIFPYNHPHAAGLKAQSVPTGWPLMCSMFVIDATLIAGAYFKVFPYSQLQCKCWCYDWPAWKFQDFCFCLYYMWSRPLVDWLSTNRTFNSSLWVSDTNVQTFSIRWPFFFLFFKWFYSVTVLPPRATSSSVKKKKKVFVLLQLSIKTFCFGNWPFPADVTCLL